MDSPELCVAAYSGDTERVRKLLPTLRREQLNEKNSRGQTALYCAARQGYIDIVEELLRASGIDANAQERNGSTALHAASYAPHPKVLSLLLSYGCDTNVRNNAPGAPAGLTAWAEARGPAIAVWKLFVEGGKDALENAGYPVYCSGDSIQEGFIYKEGEKVTTWRKRYLVLTAERLSYYTKDNKKEKKGEILVRTIKNVVSMPNYKSRKNVFGINTTINARTYYIQATSDATMSRWVESIASAQRGPKPAIKFTPLSVPKSSTDALAHAENDSPGSEQKKSISLDDFEKLNVIGRGGFARVLLVRKKDTRRVYAMKILKKSFLAMYSEVEHTKSERQVLVTLAELNHPFLAHLHFAFQTDEELFLVMEYVNGGDLFRYLQQERRFPEDRVKFYAAQIVSAVQCLHESGIIYRDLKPENILLNHLGYIVMTDFGVSKTGLMGKDARTETLCGTPIYVSPEMLTGQPYTKAVDWWSVGTVIFEMMNGLPPYYADDPAEMYEKILTNELQIPEHFSPEMADFVRQLLIRDPVKRLQDPAKIRAHAWFKSIEWDKLERMEFPAPFIPNVKGPHDISNLDPEFANEDVDTEPLQQSGGEGQPPLPKGLGKDDFQNFTFVSNFDDDEDDPEDQ